MKNYELIHEVYDLCNGKPDSQISEVQTDDLDVYMKDQDVYKRQLHAYKLEVPEIEGKLAVLSDKKFTANVPELFYKIIKAEQLEESYHENLG